jgi:hypothetical protein
MLQAFEWVRRRGERERGKGKNERCVGRGCHKYPIANGRNNICKINGKNAEKWKY